MTATEYDLFPTSAFPGDSVTPVLVCRACGCLVANTFDGRNAHVRFHNERPGS